MKALRSWLPFLLLLLCVLLLSQIWRQHLALARLESQLGERDTQVAQVQERSERLRRQIVELKAQHQTDEKAKTSAPAVVSEARAPGSPVDLSPYLRKDPAYAELRRKMELQTVTRQYGDLRSLNLSSAQTEKLRDLLADRDSAPNDARQIALEQGIPENSPEISQAMRAASKEVDGEVQALIGDDALKRLDVSRSAFFARSQLQNQLAPDMAAAGQALTADQLDALAAAQLQANQSPRSGDRAAAQQAQLEAAAKILSPDQLAVYQQSQALNSQMQQMQQRALEAAKKDLGEVHSFSWRFP